MIYNAFALPFYVIISSNKNNFLISRKVAFSIKKNVTFIFMEALFIGESFLHILVNSITAVYIDDILISDWGILLRNYMKTKFFYVDLLCMIPLNLLLSTFINYNNDLIFFLMTWSFFLKLYIYVIYN